MQGKQRARELLANLFTHSSLILFVSSDNDDAGDCWVKSCVWVTRRVGSKRVKLELWNDIVESYLCEKQLLWFACVLSLIVELTLLLCCVESWGVECKSDSHSNSEITAFSPLNFVAPIQCVHLNQTLTLSPSFSNLLSILSYDDDNPKSSYKWKRRSSFIIRKWCDVNMKSIMLCEPAKWTRKKFCIGGKKKSCLVISSSSPFGVFTPLSLASLLLLCRSHTWMTRLSFSLHRASAFHFVRVREPLPSMSRWKHYFW